MAYLDQLIDRCPFNADATWELETRGVPILQSKALYDQWIHRNRTRRSREVLALAAEAGRFLGILERDRKNAAKADERRARKVLRLHDDAVRLAKASGCTEDQAFAWLLKNE